MTFLWILPGIVYIACWIYFGLSTFRKGHYWLFWIGFFLPFLWIIGALIAPTPAAAGGIGASRGMRNLETWRGYSLWLSGRALVGDGGFRDRRKPLREFLNTKPLIPSCLEAR